MKNIYFLKIIFALLSLVASSVSAQTVKENDPAKPDPSANVSEELAGMKIRGSGLDELIKSSIKEKKTDWKLIGISKNGYGSSGQLWKFKKDQVGISSQIFDSVEKAREVFNNNKDPFRNPLGISTVSLNNIGEEAFIRPTNRTSNSPMELSFIVGKYLIILSGKKQNVLTLTEYFQSAVSKFAAEKQ